MGGKSYILPFEVNRTWKKPSLGWTVSTHFVADWNLFDQGGWISASFFFGAWPIPSLTSFPDLLLTRRRRQEIRVGDYIHVLAEFPAMWTLIFFRANNKELRECRDQIQMYQEMTAVKDQVVVSLTDQVKYFSLHPGSFSCYTTIPRRGGK